MRVCCKGSDSPERISRPTGSASHHAQPRPSLLHARAWWPESTAAVRRANTRGAAGSGARRPKGRSSRRPEARASAAPARPGRRRLVQRRVLLRRRRMLLLLLLHQRPGVHLAVRPAVDLEVAVPQGHVAHTAPETTHVVLHPRLVLEVLALDAPSAAPAEAAVQLVVVQLAVRPVVQDVKGRRRERLLAGGADETRFVVAAGEAPVGARDRLALDRQAAGPAVAPARLGDRGLARPGLGAFLRGSGFRRPGGAFPDLLNPLRRARPARGRHLCRRQGRGNGLAGPLCRGAVRERRGRQGRLGRRFPSAVARVLDCRVDPRVITPLLRPWRPGAQRRRPVPDIPRWYLEGCYRR